MVLLDAMKGCLFDLEQLLFLNNLIDIDIDFLCIITASAVRPGGPKSLIRSFGERMKKCLSNLMMFLGIISLCLVIPMTAFGKIKWAGCGISKKAYMTEVSKAFEKKTNIRIELAGGGATKGIRDTAAGITDMGGSCRHLILNKAEKGVRLYPVAWDAIVAIVNPRNSVNSITVMNLKKVFSGEINNWRQLGGENKPIAVFVRKGQISGVGMMGRELIFGNPTAKFVAQQEFKSSGPLEKAIEKDKYAIGLTGISSAKKRRVKVLALNGIMPSVDNIASGKYKLYRPLYLVAPKKPTSEVKKFLKFVRSPEGQAVIKAQGTVTLKQGKRLWKPYREHMKKVVGDKKGIFD